VQKQILRLIAQLQADRGTAILFVTHDLGVVAKISQKVSVLYAGKIVEEADVAALFAAPRHPYTRALMAAMPRYTDPLASLKPVDEAVLAGLAAEIAEADREWAQGDSLLNSPSAQPPTGRRAQGELSKLSPGPRRARRG
jgi:peptide/nickel transport system ATP-binding protein